jgi:hypothetical protein
LNNFLGGNRRTTDTNINRCVRTHQKSQTR